MAVMRHMVKMSSDDTYQLDILSLHEAETHICKLYACCSRGQLAGIVDPQTSCTFPSLVKSVFANSCSRIVGYSSMQETHAMDQ